MLDKPEEFLRDLFENTLSHANASKKLEHALHQLPQANRCVVFGAGKAAASMAEVAEKCLGDIETGLVIVPDGYGGLCNKIEVIEAGHPVPDQRGVIATARILDIANNLEEGDRAVVLLSGGGSSLLCAPLDPLGLSDKQNITQSLLSSGANIHEINCVRRHLSHVKGGRLAQAIYPAMTTTFIISDVTGDRLADIASGPTVGDETSVELAKDILAKYNLTIDPALASAFANPQAESISSEATTLSRAKAEIIMTPEDAFTAAIADISKTDLQVMNLGADVTGEARQVAHIHSDMALAALDKPTPSLILSGGELTVTDAALETQGGPNQEYALSAAVHLEGRAGIYLLACDTDGKDGNSSHAGALVSPDTLAKAATANLNATLMLDAHQSHSFFETIGQAVVTGPTRNNINDFRAILIIPPA